MVTARQNRKGKARNVKVSCTAVELHKNGNQLLVGIKKITNEKINKYYSYSVDSGIMNEIHIPCAKLSAMDKKKIPAAKP